MSRHGLAKLIACIVALSFAWGVHADTPQVQNVTAKQRFPWNGLVDITCTVTGINGTTNGLEFIVAAVMPDSEKGHNVSHFWVVQNGTKTADCMVQTNGNYRLLWDAQADLGLVIYSNMVVRVTTVRAHNKIQLWAGGPYWAETNIGAEVPWEYGYYFWWGDTVGYKYENDTWVARDGSSSGFSFSVENVPTCNKEIDTMKNEGWITADEVLAKAHDAALALWGGRWRLPTIQELSDLNSKCDWTWTATNGVKGYVVRGRGEYASASIFLPAAGSGEGTSLVDAGSSGEYWSSVPDLGNVNCSRHLYFWSGYPVTSYVTFRRKGCPVRPLQGFTE